MPHIIYPGGPVPQDQNLQYVPAPQPNRADNSPPTHPTKAISAPKEADSMGHKAPVSDSDAHTGTQMPGGITKTPL